MEFVVHAMLRGIINQLHLQQPLLSGTALTGRQVLTACLGLHRRDFWMGLFWMDEHRAWEGAAVGQPAGAEGPWAGRRSSYNSPAVLGDAHTRQCPESSSKHGNASGSRIRLPPRSRWDKCRNAFYRCWAHVREMLGRGGVRGAGLPIYLPWKT